jgi:hypothetical protein
MHARDSLCSSASNFPFSASTRFFTLNLHYLHAIRTPPGPILSALFHVPAMPYSKEKGIQAP